MAHNGSGFIYFELVWRLTETTQDTQRERQALSIGQLDEKAK